MTKEEFIKKAKYNGYTDEEIHDLIQVFRTKNAEMGMPETPYEDIPLFYKRY